MTTSGTYNFSPSLGEITLNAFARCGLRRTSLTQEHFVDARLESNYMLASWANQGVNLWKVDKVSIPLTQGVSTYSAASLDSITNITTDGVYATFFYSSTNSYQKGDKVTVSGVNPTDYNGTYSVALTGTLNSSPYIVVANTSVTAYVSGGTIQGNSAVTVMVLDAYITINPGTASQFDRAIMPISRTEYAQTPNKNLQAPPTSFWFDRLINPTITLWPVPDQTNYYTLTFYRVIQIQDAELSKDATVDVPYRWLDAMGSGLAARLAVIYAPDRLQLLEAKATQAYDIAATQDVENVALYIMPGLSGYYRMS